MSKHDAAAKRALDLFVALAVMAVLWPLFALRAPSLADGGMFAPLSREGALVLNTVLLAAATGVVFVGTLYPQLLDMLSGEKVTVGAPYFNQTFLPLFAIIATTATAPAPRIFGLRNEEPSVPSLSAVCCGSDFWTLSLMPEIDLPTDVAKCAWSAQIPPCSRIAGSVHPASVHALGARVRRCS